MNDDDRAECSRLYELALKKFQPSQWTFQAGYFDAYESACEAKRVDINDLKVDAEQSRNIAMAIVKKEHVRSQRLLTAAQNAVMGMGKPSSLIQLTLAIQEYEASR